MGLICIAVDRRVEKGQPSLKEKDHFWRNRRWDRDLRWDSQSRCSGGPTYRLKLLNLLLLSSVSVLSEWWTTSTDNFNHFIKKKKDSWADYETGLQQSDGKIGGFYISAHRDNTKWQIETPRGTRKMWWLSYVQKIPRIAWTKRPVWKDSNLCLHIPQFTLHIRTKGHKVQGTLCGPPQ